MNSTAESFLFDDDIIIWITMEADRLAMDMRVETSAFNNKQELSVSSASVFNKDVLIGVEGDF